MKKNNKKQPLKIPKTVQESIPYTRVYADNGLIETVPGTFTRSYLLEDINYQIAKEAEKSDMFLRYCSLLNSFDPAVKFEITINNRAVNRKDFEKSVLIHPQGDKIDMYRDEYNKILKDKMNEGKNNLKSEKYLTVSINADNVVSAQQEFGRIDGEIESIVKRIGSEAIPLTSTQRLEILYDIYNLGREEDFGAKLRLSEDDKTVFDFNNLHRLGITTKDAIGPDGFEFKSSYMRIGEKYARALYISELPAFLQDSFIADITNIGCNLVCSINGTSIPQDKALRIVRNKITDVDANLVDAQKRASRSGYSAELVSPDLKSAKDETNELLEDLTGRDQKMFFTTLVLLVFADSKDELKEKTETIYSIARRHLIGMRKLMYQQEDGLNTALPLCINKLLIKRTLTTESLGVFMPFTSQELSQQDGIYYGVNSVSKNLILFNRCHSKNANGLILGTPGSGKSFSAKNEMINVLLNTKTDEVIVIDPQREYPPMAKLLDGEVVKIAAGCEDHINPLDLCISSASEDPLPQKCDFLSGLITAMTQSDRYGLTAVQKSVIDRTAHLVYRDLLEDYAEHHVLNPDKMPTLADFADILREQPELEAQELATSMEMFTTGSYNLFSYKTNVNTHKRFVVYDVKDVGPNLVVPAMDIVMDAAWQRMVKNRQNGIRTWIYIDEIHMLLKYDATANSFCELYKLARKWGGVPTGMTQNVNDVLSNNIAQTIISNCDFIMMLNQAPMDRTTLASLLKISDTQLSYITNSDPGCGLIYTSKSIVPFENKFPKNTKMYKAMSTTMSDMTESEIASLNSATDNKQLENNDENKVETKKE